MPKFRSKLERTVSEILTSKQVEFQFEPERLDYVLHCQYIPDFVLNSGIILEVKGVLTQEDRRKMKAVREANPDRDIRFVFQRPFSRLPDAQATHAQWAERKGFKWAPFNDIPDDWLR